MEESQINEVVNIISNRYLSSVYQPIVSLKDGRIYAYEALSRIIYKGASINIAQLFERAGELGFLWELEKICRTNALKNASNKPKGTKLFLNVDGNVLRDSKFKKGFTKEKLQKYALDAKEIVFEITERSDFNDYNLMWEVMQHYREQGYEVALDDLGSGYSGLNRLQMIKPYYIKIDYELIHELHKDKSKKSLVRMLVKYCSDMDCKLIAEGIETVEELKCLINLGVEFGQGYLLGRPKEAFEKIDKSIVKLIEELQKKKGNSKTRVGDLGRVGTVLYPTCSIEHALDLFCLNKQLSHIGVVDKKFKFYGIVKRDTIMQYMAEKKNLKNHIADIMEREVLQIDADKSLKATIGKLMVRDESRFYEPFVILNKDRFFGIATVRDVITAIGKEL